MQINKFTIKFTFNDFFIIINMDYVEIMWCTLDFLNPLWYMCLFDKFR